MSRSLRSRVSPCVADRIPGEFCGWSLIRMSCVALVLTVSSAAPVRAAIFGGIDFPQGASSFADAVIRFDQLHSGGPGPSPAIPTINDPLAALGPPDFVAANFDFGYATLGRGGLIELRFVDNLLTNSGNNLNDLHIFEIGPDVEDT